MRRTNPRSDRRRLSEKCSMQRKASFRAERSVAYIYAILVDGVVRYIGKGRNGRMYTHLIDAKRSAARCAVDTGGLHPRLHRKLVEAIRDGSQFGETIVASGLTDRAAYGLESKIIGQFHKLRAGQLWNTIDERFMDPRFLPEEWHDPENSLYKLPRPLGAHIGSPEHNRDGVACDQALEKALAVLGWNEAGQGTVASGRHFSRKNFRTNTKIAKGVAAKKAAERH